LAVHADHPEGGQERNQLAEGAHLTHASRRTQADEGRLPDGLEEVDVGGVDRPATIPCQVQEQPVVRQFHGSFLPRAVAEGK
jgi:hypothetical protein